MSAPSNTLVRSAVKAGAPVTSAVSPSGRSAEGGAELVDRLGDGLLPAGGVQRHGDERDGAVRGDLRRG